jgi:kumamolisin
MAAAKRFSSQKRIALPGSMKTAAVATPPLEGADAAKKESAQPAKTSFGKFTVSVVTRPKEAIDTKKLGKVGFRLTRAEYNKRHAGDPAAVKLVKAFAGEYGLTTEGPKPGHRTVHVTGSAAAMQKAFGVELKSHELDGTKYRVREGEITLPEELIGHVTAVLGLDNRPQAKPHYRVKQHDGAGGVASPNATSVSYTPVQVATLYGYPAGAKATGQTIGLIELGGGYKAADITTYFKGLGVTAPTVTAVLVDKAKNAPTNANSADGEVLLDIEVAGAVAPGAKIAVYFAPNTDQGFIDAISTAVHDTKNKPSVISISWGGPESTWTAQSITALDAACQAAAALGVTITVAAGDDGSTDGVTGTTNHVDFPASSPHVLGCGGTKLVGSGSKITSEVVWNETAAKEGATGGGVSNVFPLPTWQANAKVPKATVAAGGRGVPDVSGNADPSTGYSVRVDGANYVFGGTSAVAPLWAGLIALANAANKSSAGFINPTIYAASAKTSFRDITSGNNGGFSAAVGWDACTGLGSPVGANVVKLLAKTTTSTGTTKKGKAVAAAPLKAAAKKTAALKMVAKGK